MCIKLAVSRGLLIHKQLGVIFIFTYLHDPLMDLPQPAMNIEKQNFMRSCAENPPMDLLHPSMERAFFLYKKEKFMPRLHKGLFHTHSTREYPNYLLAGHHK